MMQGRSPMQTLEAAVAQEQPRYAGAVEAGDFDTAAVSAGEGIDLVRDTAPAAVIVERLVAEADDVCPGLTIPSVRRPTLR